MYVLETRKMQNLYRKRLICTPKMNKYAKFNPKTAYIRSKNEQIYKLELKKH
jgi:hypothetical protein